ncbi:MAG: hypothetical protein U0T79_08570 [Ferruginibacter sp.]
MKKQFLFLVLISFSTLFILSLRENDVKACGKKAAAAGVRDCRKMKLQAETIQDGAGMPDKFMNPFAQY